MENEGVQYYWCVNCGHHGDLRKKYKIKKSCEECGYDEITPYTKEEIEENENLWMERFKKKSS